MRSNAGRAEVRVTASVNSPTNTFKGMLNTKTFIWGSNFPEKAMIKSTNNRVIMAGPTKITPK